MSTPFTGSLANKRKSELVEIAQALGESDPESLTVPVLRTNIQAQLEKDEDHYIKDPQFKGLIHKKRSSPHGDIPGSPTSVASVKAAIGDTAAKGRKSINKIVEKIQELDAASIPLPESPLSKIQESVQEAANTSLALIQHPPTSKELTRHIKTASNSLIKFGGEGQERVEIVIERLRDYLSTPDKLLVSATVVELLFLVGHVVQFYDHSISFPPPGGESGTISSLLHSLFFWLPTMELKVRTPELRGFFPSSDLWPAFFWWFFTTVIPPLALSTLTSPAPSSSSSKVLTTRSTRSQPSKTSSIPKPDPLTYSLIRLAILLFPLTSAAPSTFVDSLGLSGNAQGRALGAALVVGLIGAALR